MFSKIRAIAIATVFSSLFSTPFFTLKATSILGASMEFQRVNGDTFIVSVNAFRDCNGINMSSTPIQYNSGGSSTTVSTTMTSGIDVTPKCASVSDRCTNSGSTFAFGVEKVTLSAKIVLNSSLACRYSFSWEQCCRSSAITTGPAGEDFYLEDSVNICKLKTGSPKFQFDPMMIICVNQCIDRFQSAVGENGDSLVYSFGHPLRASGDEIPYTAGYAYDQPVQFFGFPNRDLDFDPPYCKGFHLNSQTGEIQFKATAQDVSVFVIKVQQLQKVSGKYQKVSEIAQDMVVTVYNCPADRPPVISGVNGTSISTINIPIGKQSTFYVSAFDADATDSVLLDWDKGIPGAVFSLSSARLPTGTFTWKPAKSDSGTHVFIVTAREKNVCPLPAIIQRAFIVNVKMIGLGIEDSDVPTISVFPNPADRDLIIGCDREIRELSIVNTLGVKVYSAGRPAVDKSVVDVSKFAPGIYFISVSGEGWRKIEKVVIQR